MWELLDYLKQIICNVEESTLLVLSNSSSSKYIYLHLLYTAKGGSLSLARTALWDNFSLGSKLR